MERNNSFKKLINLAKPLLLLLVLTGTLTGCTTIDSYLHRNNTAHAGEEGNAPYAVGIVVDVHANSACIRPESVADYLYQAAEQDGNVVIVTSEGAPQILYNGKAMGSDTIQNSWSEDKKHKHYLAAAMEIMESYENGIATSSGNDIRKAIALAAGELTNRKNADRSKILIIADTGLGTVSPMDFRGNILMANPQDVVLDLQNKKALPDLTGVDMVVWYGIGSVSAPQDPLSPEEEYQLKAIWEAILRAAGAKEVIFEGVFTEPMVGQNGEALPEVPVIDLTPMEQNVYTPSWAEDEDQGLQIGEDTLYFEPGQATFKDVDAAKEALGAVATELSAHPEARILLAACTASLPSDEAGCYDLSDRRAKACMDLLMDIMVNQYHVEKSVAENQMECIGLAYHDPWHIDDLNDSGHQIEDLATRNRRIVILDRESSLAINLLNSRH